MTRPSTLTLAVSLLLPFSLSRAQAPSGQQTPLQELGSSFQSHQKGQPFLDQDAGKARTLICQKSGDACAGFEETLLKARAIQEGCSEPCDSASDVELYRAKISLVCEELDLDFAGCGKAADNYIPSGVPRKKPSAGDSPEQRKFEAQAITALLSDPSIDPRLRTELNDRALKLAEALGRLQWTDAEGGSVVSAKEPLGALQAAVAGGTAGLKPLPTPSGVPIPASQVEGRFQTALRAKVSQYPTGAAVLKAADPPPPISFENIPDKDGYTILAYYENNKQKMVFNSQRVAEFIRRLDPATAQMGLENAARLKEYLAKNPGALDQMASHFDVLYVHEMTHRGQHLKAGTGLVDNILNGWKQLLSGNKYPVEHEWEAFGNQNKYFSERGKKEPGIFDYRDSPELGVMEHEGYVKDLQAYRRSIASLYSDSCDTADKLRFFKKEKPSLDAELARQAMEWPLVAYDGNMGLARHWGGSAWPDMSFGYIAKAYARASQGGFLDKTKPEMTELFTAMVRKLDAKLAEQKPDSPIRGLRDPAGLLKLSKDLGVPLPPRVAAAMAAKPTATPAPKPAKKTPAKKQ